MGWRVMTSKRKGNSVRTLSLKLFLLFFITLAGCGRADTASYKIPDEVVKWPFKSPDKLITVRIPGGYRFWGGAAMSAILGPGYPDPDKQLGFTPQLFIDTLWPDMVPRTPQNQHEFDVPGGGRGLSIQVNAIFGPRDKKEDETHIAEDKQIFDFDGSKFAIREERIFERKFHLLKRSASFAGDGQKAYRFPLEPLPGKFGLLRVGIDLDKHPARLDPKFASSIYDFYYLRDQKGRLQTYIRCESETVRDHEDDPSSIYAPHCDQHFFYAPLSGEVEVSYRRKYLGDWRSIQTKTEQLLQSFIQ